jgi:cation transport regulator ChaC
MPARRAQVSPDKWLPFERIARSVGTIAAIGSLVWKPIPGTTPVAAIAIDGYRKDFNTRVLRCRGTSTSPGLVFGLEPDRTTAAHGVLLSVNTEDAHSVWTTFLSRELDDADYVPTIVAARRLDNGEAVQAVAVLVDTRSASYFRRRAGALALMIQRAEGSCGTNLEYALRCFSADREIHGNLPKHLAQLEANLRPDNDPSEDTICPRTSQPTKCKGFCFAS